MKKFAIIIPTYRRTDGKTPYYLQRCVNSVLSQTCKDFCLFIIGDKYENDFEIKPLISKDMYYENLPTAPERDKYSGYRLWCCGGCSAVRHGIQVALSKGFEYLIVLDHDDYWAKNHLQLFKDNLPFSWACTKSTYKGNKILPAVATTDKVTPFLPMPNKLIKSSVCWNYFDIPLIPRNVYEETGEEYPSDADLWIRMANYLNNRNLATLFINELTCFHDTEGYALHNT